MLGLGLGIIEIPLWQMDSGGGIPSNGELREDGSFELREDGSFELRE